MSESLIDISKRICVSGDPAAKNQKFYAIYDRYFEEFRDRPITMLELGVHTGESLKVWSTYFPQGTIIGLDLELKADFSDYPNIVFEQTDQTNTDRLKDIAQRGLDIILDDASHIGVNTMFSFATLFPYLNPGGLYIIEDWCTGYLNDWPDGKYPENLKPKIDGNRIQSHDFGMVGFVKSLVDEVVGDNLKRGLREPPVRLSTVSFVHFYKQTVILQKL